MAILYGTQSNGETLPVLVDQFGNLLAKGIEGEPGEPGAPGPPGPPGVGELPPDPFEGAILGWEDGELAWLGGSVPLPAGTYGPYTYIAGNEQLNIPQDASSLVNGQQLYMSNEKGEPVNVEYRTDTIASVGDVDAVASYYLMNSLPTNLADLLANGTPYTQGASVSVDQYFIRRNDIDPGNGIKPFSAGGTAGFIQYSSLGEGPYEPDGTLIPINNGSFGGSEWTSFVCNDATPTVDPNRIYQIFTSPTVGYQVFQFTGAGTGPTIASIDFKVLTFPTDNNFDKFEVGDVVQSESGVLITAIDDTVPSITVNGGSFSGSDGSGSGGDTYLETEWSGAGSVFVGLDGAIVLRNNNEQWVNDFYVTAPAQEVAARKVAANARKLRKK